MLNIYFKKSEIHQECYTEDLQIQFEI